MIGRCLLSGVIAAVALFCAARPASAQEETGFGEHPFVLSLENLGGVVHQRMKFEDQDDTETFTIVGTYPAQPDALLGLHYFVARPITVGVLLNYSDNDDFGTKMIAGLRVGAALPFDDQTALWLRGGVSYWSQEDADDEMRTDVRPGAEALFVLQPVEHFGFLIGAMFEIGVAGTDENTTTDFATGEETTEERDFDYMAFGLTFGVLADF